MKQKFTIKTDLYYKLKNTLLNKKSSKLLFSIICGIILFPDFGFLFGIYDDWNIGLMELITPKGSSGFILVGWMCCLIFTLIVWILFIVILFIVKKDKQARKNK